MPDNLSLSVPAHVRVPVKKTSFNPADREKAAKTWAGKARKVRKAILQTIELLLFIYVFSDDQMQAETGCRILIR